MSTYSEEQTWRTKLKEKTKRNPFVPLFAMATFGTLVAGLAAFHRKNASLSQRLMRARVIAQGATVASMVGGGLHHMYQERNEPEDMNRYRLEEPRNTRF